MSETMTSNRPYLLRALSDWIIDNGMTPHLLVDVDKGDVEVPRQFAENGRIILNIHPEAVDKFSLTNESLSFSTRFGGRPYHIYLPIKAVLAIYAKENGKGMIFPDEPEDEQSNQDELEENKKKKESPHLKVIK